MESSAFDSTFTALNRRCSKRILPAQINNRSVGSIKVVQDQEKIGSTVMAQFIATAEATTYLIWGSFATLTTKQNNTQTSSIWERHYWVSPCRLMAETLKSLMLWMNGFKRWPTTSKKRQKREVWRSTKREPNERDRVLQQSDIKIQE